MTRFGKAAATLAVTGLAIGAALTGASPAQAAGGPGWYSTQPYALGTCSAFETLVTGSDLKPMEVRVCAVKWSTNQVRVTTEFVSKSKSSIGVDSTLLVYDNSTPWSLDGGECGVKTLVPGGHLYCAGKVVNVLKMGVKGSAYSSAYTSAGKWVRARDQSTALIY